MQNVVNLHTPFLVGGNPIVNGRVYFVKVGTDAQTFNQVAGLDNAFFINVYDKDGHNIENPLPLDSEGCFSVQPFVEDCTDFKMIVCRPTGISPDLEDDTAAWAVAYTMVSKSQEIKVSYEGIASCDSVTALRQQDAGVGSVLVLGYAAANDFCPPRIFTWKPTALTDNGGTHIRSLKQGQQNAGTWICEPQGCVDVRWFGVEPGTAASTEDCWTVVNAIVSSYYPDLPVYFPKGYYRLSENLTVNSAMILDKGAYIRPRGKSITVEINRLENRGGVFQRTNMGSGTTTYNVYPKVNGELRASWMSNPGEQISTDMLANVTELVFDSNTDFGTDYTISKKRVLINKGVTLQHALFENCLVYNEDSATLEITSLLAKSLGFEGKVNLSAETAHSENGLVVKLLANGELVRAFEIFRSMATLFAGFKAEYLLVGDEDGENFQNGCYENPDVFEGALSIIFRYGYFNDLLYAKDVNIGGGISHAKSARSKIVLTLSYDGAWSMNVKKDGVDYGNLDPMSGFFYLGMLEDDQQNHIDIFAGSRDFDVYVYTDALVTADPIKIVLPDYEDGEDAEKIVAVNYHPFLMGANNDKGLKLYKSTEFFGSNEELKYYGQPENLDNSFFGTKIVRKEVGGKWFFDPFAI